MANTTSKRKTTSKGRKTVRRPAVKKRQPKKSEPVETQDIFSQLSGSARKQLKKLGSKLGEDRDIMPQISDSTREQLRKLGDKLNEATDKGVVIAKDVAERVRHFASEATELTKLKIELHKLKNSRDKVISGIGEKLVGLHKAKKLNQVESTFKNDFARLEKLKAEISEMEKAVKKISL
jgi:wobble nucleotide-excising tRNase